MDYSKLYFDIDNLKFHNLYDGKNKKHENISLNIRNINCNLLMNKYVIWQGDEAKILCPKYCNSDNYRNLMEYISIKNNKIMNYYKERYKYEVAECLKVENCSKLVIGHGEISVRDTSIKLDHIYGIPFIPATSIKGAFRNYINNKYRINDDDKKSVENTEQIIKMFGNNDKKGEIIFLDSYPKNFEIDVDVMTPHYVEYYSNSKLPRNDLEPNPIEFPVIKKGSEFEIIILCKYKCFNLNGKDNVNIIDEFKSFLKEMPLGAKTSVGYGRIKCK